MSKNNKLEVAFGFNFISKNGEPKLCFEISVSSHIQASAGSEKKNTEVRSVYRAFSEKPEYRRSIALHKKYTENTGGLVFSSDATRSAVNTSVLREAEEQMEGGIEGAIAIEQQDEDDVKEVFDLEEDIAEK